jgi:hypothetical protein
VVAAGAAVGASVGCTVVPQATTKNKTSIKGMDMVNLVFPNQR